MLHGIYLGAFRAYHPKWDIVYQDINGLRDLGGDMMDVDLTNYDYVIATPPCNYWSVANYRRDQSEYALKTRHLLPGIIDKLIASNLPFIVENVRNDKAFRKIGLFDKDLFVYKVGRHTYWTNIFLFGLVGCLVRQKGVQNCSRSSRQGGEEVNSIIEEFIHVLHGCN